MQYIIAIPSYNRPKQIQTKTLKYLKECGIDKKLIYIFVANAEQEVMYKEVIPTYNIVVGELGITRQRNFISNYFDEGQYVVSMDDDIERLELADHACNCFQPLFNLDDTLKENYQLMLKESRYIWGIYPVRNLFFIRKPFNIGLAFIIGVCFGYINRRIMLDVCCEGKEDIENSLLHYLRDGGVLRINTMVAKTKFNAIGGLGKDRFDSNKKAAEALHLKYPTLTRIFQRKNGMYEIKLFG
jgi:hypothetical protein